MSTTAFIIGLVVLLLVACVALFLMTRYAMQEHRKVVTLKPIAEREAKRKQAMAGKTIVYAIPDPMSGEICYVGMTMKDERTRLKEHIDEAMHVSSFHLLIRERMAQGFEWSEVIVLEMCETRTHAYQRESHWIRHGKTELNWPLVNGARRQ